MLQSIVKAALPAAAAVGFIAMTAGSAPAFTLSAPCRQAGRCFECRAGLLRLGLAASWGRGYSKFTDGVHYFDTLADDVLFEFRYHMRVGRR